MIQRNGRINRLGTPFDTVYVYNIGPEDQLEEYLRLIHRLESKIKLIKSTIGTDTPILDEDANPLEFTDSLKDIYSEDLQKRIEAIKDAESESDFLLAEDEYVSDLKLFHNSASESDKKIVYGIPLGKWCMMPKTKFRGDSQRDRPAVMALSQLLDQNKRLLGHAFLSTSRTGGKVEMVQTLQALEWLKTNKDDNKKELDKLTLPKMNIKETVSRISLFYRNEEEIADIEPQQGKVLNIMYQNQFSEKDINDVRELFSSTNTLDKQKTSQLVRKIMRADKAGKIDNESIKKLVSLVKNGPEEKVDPIKINDTKQVLFYVKDNL